MCHRGRPVREALGLPMSGKVRFVFDLDLPNEKSKAGKTGKDHPVVAALPAGINAEE